MDQLVLSLRVYVSQRAGDTVSVIDGAGETMVTSVKVGDTPARVAVDPSNNRGYVTNYMDDTVSVIDGSTNNVVATVEVDRNPYAVAVDPSTKHVFVANVGGKPKSAI